MNKTLPLTILIADDDQDDIEFLTFLFGQHPGFELAGALSNGREVINFINAATKLPDVLLIDMYMPLLNGAEVVGQLIGSGQAEKMAIFVISSLADEMLKQNFDDAATLEFLQKPGNLEQVNDLPEMILERLRIANINRI